MAILRKIYALPAHRRRLLFEAGWRLAAARAAVSLLPFRRISPTLGTPMSVAESGLNDRQQQMTRDISWAIAAASGHLPIGAVCIHQAIAAKHMLSSRHIPNTLYLGTRKKDGALEAHAWVMSGEIPVTGAQGRSQFSVISSFS